MLVRLSEIDRKSLRSLFCRMNDSSTRSNGMRHGTVVHLSLRCRPPVVARKAHFLEP